MKLNHIFTIFSTAVAEGAGKPVTFGIAFIVIVVWAISGPFFDYSETWQLVVNTATTIVTFLMVFVLQNSQNRDSKAIQAKLDELILTSKAQNKFIGVENLDENELRELSKSLHKQAERIEAKVDRKRTKKKPVEQTTKSAPPKEGTVPLPNSLRATRGSVISSSGKTKS